MRPGPDWHPDPPRPKPPYDLRPYDQAPPPPSAWPELMPGVLQAVFISVAYAFLAWGNFAETRKTAQVVTALFLLFLIHAALASPRRLPLLLAAYLPYGRSFGYVHSSGLNLTNVMIAVVAVGLVVARARNSQRRRFEAIDYLLIAFMAVALASTLWGNLQADAASSVRDLLGAYKLLILPLIIYFAVRSLTRSREDAAALLTVVAVSAVLVGIHTWIAGVENRHGSIEASRVGGIMQQPNAMGAFLVYYGLPLLALGVIARTWLYRALAWAGFLIVAYSALFTYSRAAYAALVIGTLAIVLIRSRALLFVVLSLLILAVSLFPEVIPETVMTRIGHTFQGSSEQIYADSPLDALDSSSLGRLALWEAGYRMVLDRPLLGVGLGRMRDHIRSYLVREVAREQVTDAHNAYVLMAGELGLPALLIMLIIQWKFGAAALRLYRRSENFVDRGVGLAFFGSAIGVAVSCLFGSRFSDAGLIGNYWALAAVMCGANRAHAADLERLAAAGWHNPAAKPVPMSAGIASVDVPAWVHDPAAAHRR